MLRRRTADPARERRGASMVEFALLLPFILFLALFAVDLGRVVVMTGAVNDAAYTAARAGAQSGQPGHDNSGIARDALDRALHDHPLLDPDNFVSFSVTPTVCRATGQDRYVDTQMRYDVNLLTPGLGDLIGVTVDRQGENDGTWQLTGRATALCEVVR